MLASERVAQKENGSRGDVAISSSIAFHVEKREREVEPLLHREGGDVTSRGGGVWFEFPV